MEAICRAFLNYYSGHQQLGCWQAAEMGTAAILIASLCLLVGAGALVHAGCDAAVPGNPTGPAHAPALHPAPCRRPTAAAASSHTATAASTATAAAAAAAVTRLLQAPAGRSQLWRRCTAN